MADVIWGDVTQVIDGDTFDVTVTHYSRANEVQYNDRERIRIADIDAPELRSPFGQRAWHQLERTLVGQHVRLEVQARDVYHRLVCRVSRVAKSA
jgi:endonuclease YncB( thermonuclease family)